MQIVHKFLTLFLCCALLQLVIIACIMTTL